MSENKNIYIDLLLSNSVQTSPNDRVPVKFNLSQSQPILRDSTGYLLSVIRFSLNTETLPIFIPQMSDNGDESTIYSCTMEYNGTVFQKYMDFIPQNINPIDTDEKYYVYSYQYVIYLINNMLNQCLVGLNNLLQTPATIEPKMLFNRETQACSMQLDSSKYGYNETGKINIYMNTQMYALVSTLPSSTVYQTNGMDFQLNNLISEDPSLLVQEQKTIELWNPVSSLVFTSNLLPIYESVTAPLQVYVDGSLSDNNTSYHFLNIMTDFIGDEMLFTPYVQYAPSIYRFLNLKPNNSIRNVDLQVYWMNKNTGKLKPLYLIVGGSCSVKLYLNKP